MDNKTPEGRIYSILGIVSAVLSLIIIPIVSAVLSLIIIQILFGPIAVVLGIIAINKKDKALGITAIILGVVLAIISWIITILLAFM